MKLVHVDRWEPGHWAFLWGLLNERNGNKNVNISHQAMPSYAEHCHFVEFHPYRAWFLIEVDGSCVGSIYLSERDEIGIFLYKCHQNQGYAKEAVRLLMTKTLPRYPRRYLANINPRNDRSISFFRKLGFKPLQVTYVRDVEI